MEIWDKVEILGIGLEKEETEKFKENLKKELDNRKKDNEQEIKIIDNVPTFVINTIPSRFKDRTYDRRKNGIY